MASQRSIFSESVGEHAAAISNIAFDTNFDRIARMSLEIGSQNFAPDVAPSISPRAVI